MKKKENCVERGNLKWQIEEWQTTQWQKVKEQTLHRNLKIEQQWPTKTWVSIGTPERLAVHPPLVKPLKKEDRKL